MKAVKGNVFAVGIKGKLNTQDKSRDQWAQIVECKTGNVLHTGQPRYIKRVAKARYNTMLDIQWCFSSPVKASQLKGRQIKGVHYATLCRDGMASHLTDLYIVGASDDYVYASIKLRWRSRSTPEPTF